MKKGKARQHFLRSTRLDPEKFGHLDFSFLDEGLESLPDESRSEDFFINQDLVDPENTDLPISGNNLGTGSGQLVSDHDNDNFGEINKNGGDPTNVITVGVFLPETSVPLPTQPTQTEDKNKRVQLVYIVSKTTHLSNAT
jgi:hypothetical protein